MRENRPYGSEGGEQRYCSPTPIGLCAHGAPIFAWIPAYAGTTTYLSLATFNVLRAHHIQSARILRESSRQSLRP